MSFPAGASAEGKGIHQHAERSPSDTLAGSIRGLQTLFWTPIAVEAGCDRIEQELFSLKISQKFFSPKQRLNFLLTITSLPATLCLALRGASQDRGGLIAYLSIQTGGPNLLTVKGAKMHLTSNLDWTSKLNIAAVCVSFSFICAVFTGVF
jgi:hypothetical protein